MPEGHTLHRLARLHQQRYAASVVSVTSPQGQFVEASFVDGRVLESAEAKGKHLLHHYGPDATVHIHLGLYGTFTEFELPAPAVQGQIRMRLLGATHGTDLRGPAKCELLTDKRLDTLLARLGPDPLRADADPEQVWQRITRSRQSIAMLLMDQSVLSGVGNVYRAELLFRHGIDPLASGSSLDKSVWDAMWRDLVELMEYGVRVGRIDTVHPEHEPAVTGRPPRQDRHGGEVYVYRRAGQPCLVCQTPVASRELAGRTLYWCPTCQPS